MLYLITFLEGIITFVSPCLLPMLPIYVSYFAGGEERSVRKTLANAVAFVLGFTTIFVLLGALAGTVGSFLRTHRTAVDLVSGLVVIVFGLHYLGVFRLPFFRGNGFTLGDKPMGLLSAFLFGLIFSVGWTPCVGAFLGSALSLASQQGHVVEGILLLLVYSIGLGLPFVIGAVLIDKLKSAFAFIKRHYRVINAVSGAFLILVGVLMMSGLLGRLLTLLA